MASGLNEESVQKKLQSVTNAQDSIQSLSLWIIHHKTHHKDIVRLWLKVFKKAKAAHRLTLFYLCNDVVQNCKRKNAIVYRESFKDVIKAAAIFGRDQTIKSKVERIFNIWKERGVFDKNYIASLYSIMGTADPKPKPKSSSSSSSRSQKKRVSPAAAASTTPPVTPKAAATQVDPKLIAGFKPSSLLDKMKVFSLLEQEVELRHRQMEHIKLDASSVEAVRQLKDKTHGKEFSQQFEDSCVKLEEYIEKQDVENQSRKALLDLMETAQFFYDEQYREAKIVAIAYKNFGTRITNMSRRVNDLRKSLPIMISPVPSPALDAPSPGQTPIEDDNTEAVDMDLSDEDGGEEPSSPPDDAHALNDASEPAMAVYQPPSKKGLGDGLDKRIANLIPSLPMSHNSKKKMPEQQDVFSHSAFPDPNSNFNLQVFNAKAMLSGGSEGGSTPLSDERCSTPVQDEVPEVDPVDESNLVKQVQEAANPIDILTKLISKTQKTAPSAAESNFLQSLSLLTSTVKSQVQKAKLAKMKRTEDDLEDGDVDEGSENSGDSARQPKSWAAWKAKSNPPEETSRTPPRPIPSIQSTRSEEQMASIGSEPEVISSSPEGDLEQGLPDSMPSQLPTVHVSQGPPLQVAQAPLIQGMPPTGAPGQGLPPNIPPGPVIHPGQMQGVHPPAHQGPPMGHHQRPPGPLPGHPQGPPPRHPQGPPPGHPLGLRQGPPGQPLPGQPQLHVPPGVPLGHPPGVIHGPPLTPGMGGPPLAPQGHHQVSPPVNFMPPRLNIPPPNFSSMPPASAGFNPLMTPPHAYMPQTSPGQKENWPSSDSNQNSSPSALVPLVGLDVPTNQRTPPAAEMPNPPFSSPSSVAKVPPKSILRNSQAPVLKEVSQASGQMTDLSSPPVMSGPKPPAIPPSPSDTRPPPFLGQSQPVLQPGEDLIEFTEKLKRKTAESVPEGRPKQPVFGRNMDRPNLTTITPVEEVEGETCNMSESVESAASESGNSETNSEPIQSIQAISTLGSVVRRVEPDERDSSSHEESRGSRRKSIEHPHSGHSSRYESDYRDPYYHRQRDRPQYPPHDPYRDPYSRPLPYYHDPYGPSPHKRPYADPYDRRRPYYRY